MNIRLNVHIGRRQLVWLPPLAAITVGLLCIEWWVSFLAALVIVGTYIGVAVLLAAIDYSAGIIRTRVRARRERIAIEKSIALHPSNIVAHASSPKHRRTRPRRIKEGAAA